MQARKRRGGKQVRGEKVKVYKESSGDGELAQPWFTPLWTWGTVLAVVACLLHSMHVAALFENDRFFSYLSSLERELSFRTEMGLYYSYYKRIVEAPSLSGGVASILHDNITEYPTTINTLQRFNLYPELCLSVMYRGYHWMLGVAGTTGTKCLTISRGYGQSSIEACNGLGDPAYFYVHMIFALNGIFASVIALLGTYLSGSVWGGVFSLTAFFYNHRQATRVMWTPPLRESFALPFLLLQSLLLTVSIRQRSLSRGLWTGLALSTLAFLLPWQFSQFTLLTQVLSLSVVHSVRLIPSHTFLHILSAFSVAYVGNIVLQFGNVMLLTSFLPYCLLACAVLCVVVRLTDRLKYLPLITVVEVCLVVVASVGLKTVVTSLMGSREDEHIMSILRSKFTSYHDFHTQLYTCAAEFDFLSLTYWLDITWTLMLPMSLVVMVMVTVQVVRHVKWSTATVSTTSSTVSTTSSAVSTNLAVQLYHVMQTMAYVVMATLIMRLKSFLTPQLSVMCGILPAVVSSKSSSVGKWRVWIFSGLLVLSSLKGWHNLHLEQSVSGEYNNPQGEELVMWIHDHTPKSAVFAGSMPTMATVLLTTGRPIVNHPHYESASLRNRTKHVYTVFSRKPAPEIHAILHGMGVHYVICEDSWCRRTGYKPGCSFREMWDEEDPGNQDRPLFCEEIRRRVPTPFLPAFTNSEYRVLQVATVNNTM